MSADINAAPIAARPAPLTRFHAQLHVQVLAAILAGCVVGHFFPTLSASLKPAGDIFIKLIRMLVPGIIFVNIVLGVAGVKQFRTFGRIAGTALAYFLVVSTFALVVGLVVGNLVHPGLGMNIDPASLDAGAVSDFAERAHKQTLISFLTAVVPTTLTSAFTDGNLLQVLLVSILFGMAAVAAGPIAAPVLAVVESLVPILFKIIAMVMRLAPMGAFGAIAYTVGKYGVASLLSLASLVGMFYLTMFLFVVVVFGVIGYANGFSIFRLVAYLRTELLLVLGTSSAETAMPNLMQKLERAGCEKSVVGLVLPVGYSFNLDGTNIYITFAALFIANACNIPVSIGDQLLLLGVAVLSSKGSAGVAGAGFVTLAATLAIIPTIPVAGMALLLGVERVMGVCCALVNFTGNAVATIVVSKWNASLDLGQLDEALSGRAKPDLAA
jgi:aerobic C4-dicarboxylate transport protein